VSAPSSCRQGWWGRRKTSDRDRGKRVDQSGGLRGGQFTDPGWCTIGPGTAALRVRAASASDHAVTAAHQHTESERERPCPGVQGSVTQLFVAGVQPPPASGQGPDEQQRGKTSTAPAATRRRRWVSGFWDAPGAEPTPARSNADAPAPRTVRDAGDQPGRTNRRISASCSAPRPRSRWSACGRLWARTCPAPIRQVPIRQRRGRLVIRRTGVSERGRDRGNRLAVDLHPPHHLVLDLHRRRGRRRTPRSRMPVAHPLRVRIQTPRRAQRPHLRILHAFPAAMMPAIDEIVRKISPRSTDATTITRRAQTIRPGRYTCQHDS